MENKILEEMANEYQESWLRGYCNGTNAIKIKHAFKDGYKAGFDAAKQEDADTKKVVPQWISVKERLPEMKEVALVFSKSTYLNVAHRVVDDKGWCWSTPSMSIAPHEITHWMPLPEAPKEEKI